MLRRRRQLASRRARTEGYEDARPVGSLVTLEEPLGAASEAYRALRTNLLYAFVDAPPKVIVTTSPNVGEGKSTTCANLGVVLAQADKDTLIVDCDLRRPVIHRVFGLRNLRGLVNVLAGEGSLREVQQRALPKLGVVTAGPIPPNPAELLGSRRFAEFLDLARREFDYVLIDAPPVRMVSDAAILASQGDGVLLVLDAQNTRKNAIRQSISGLEAVGGTVIGTVMNNVKASKDGYYGYGYGGYTQE